MLLNATRRLLPFAQAFGAVTACVVMLDACLSRFTSLAPDWLPHRFAGTGFIRDIDQRVAAASMAYSTGDVSRKTPLVVLVGLSNLREGGRSRPSRGVHRSGCPLPRTVRSRRGAEHDDQAVRVASGKRSPTDACDHRNLRVPSGRSRGGLLRVRRLSLGLASDPVQSSRSPEIDREPQLASITAR